MVLLRQFVSGYSIRRLAILTIHSVVELNANIRLIRSASEALEINGALHRNKVRRDVKLMG